MDSVAWIALPILSALPCDRVGEDQPIKAGSNNNDWQRHPAATSGIGEAVSYRLAFSTPPLAPVRGLVGDNMYDLVWPWG